MSARGVFFFPIVRSLGSLCLLVPWLPAQAQVLRTANVSAQDFQRTVRRSGLIFEGTVTAIEGEAGKGKTPQTYRVSFQVRQGVRGVRTGATLAIREWAGLWTAGPASPPRYHVGEHAFLFLYPPSRAGLTSPVGGGTGKLAVTAGQVLLPWGWKESLGQAPVTAAKSSPWPASPSQAERVPVSWLVQRIAQGGE